MNQLESDMGLKHTNIATNISNMITLKQQQNKVCVRHFAIRRPPKKNAM